MFQAISLSHPLFFNVSRLSIWNCARGDWSMTDLTTTVVHHYARISSGFPGNYCGCTLLLVVGCCHTIRVCIAMNENVLWMMVWPHGVPHSQSVTPEPSSLRMNDASHVREWRARTFGAIDSQMGGMLTTTRKDTSRLCSCCGKI